MSGQCLSTARLGVQGSSVYPHSWLACSEVVSTNFLYSNFIGPVRIMSWPTPTPQQEATADLLNMQFPTWELDKRPYQRWSNYTIGPAIR